MGQSFHAEIVVRTRAELADPAGQAIRRAVTRWLGARGGGAAIETVRVGKVFDVSVRAASEAEARVAVAAIAAEVLANPIVESFEVVAVHAATEVGSA